VPAKVEMVQSAAEAVWARKVRRRSVRMVKKYSWASARDRVEG
jgi:hypothetical protein